MKTPDPNTVQWLVAGMSLLTTTIVSFGAWAIRRWISRTDAKIDALTTVVGDLRTKGAVGQERFNHLMGAIEILRGSVQTTDQSCGVLKASVDKIWTILQLKGIAKPQPSDLGKQSGG